MYAVIEDGSRQYRVSEGDLVTLDYRDAEEGARLEFNRVLLYQNGDDTRIGQPVIDGMRVLAEVIDHPSTKTIIQKFRRRKNYRRLKGHRQWYTQVRVKYILMPGTEAPSAEAPSAETPPAPPPAPPAATETPATTETPAAQTPPTPPPTPDTTGTT